MLGRAGPESSLFQGGFWVAATGLMEFDTADLPNMISNGSFTTVVLHEMAHLIEPTHTQRFIALMNRFMPKWQFYRGVLNRLPVRHETWSY